MDKHFPKKIGKKIVLFRQRKKVTQEQLSLRCGIDRTQLYRVEKGITNPTLKTAKKIALGLGIKLFNLIKN